MLTYLCNKASNNYANTKERADAMNVYNKAFLKNKWRSKASKVDCEAFAASIPNYSMKEFNVNIDVQQTGK